MQDRKLVRGYGLSPALLALWLGGQQLWGGLGAVGVVGAIATLAVPVEAAQLQQWQFNTAAKQLEVTVPAGVKPRYFILAKPARIVLELPNTQVGTVPTQQSLTGLVREVRVSQFQPDVTRIVMELSPEAVFAPGQVELKQVAESRWVLRPLFATSGTPQTAATAPVPSPTAQPAAPKPASAPTRNTATNLTSPTPASTSPAAKPPTNSNAAASEPRSPESTTSPVTSPAPAVQPAPATPPQSASPSASTPQPATSPAPAITPQRPATPRGTADSQPRSQPVSSQPAPATTPVLPSVQPSGDTATTPTPNSNVQAEPEWEPAMIAPEEPQGQPSAPAETNTAIAASPLPAPQPASDRPMPAQSVSQQGNPAETAEPVDTTLPPATFSTQRPVTVRVPSLGQSVTTPPPTSRPTELPSAQTPPASTTTTPSVEQPEEATALPPATFDSQPTVMVKVPPLRSAPTSTPMPAVETNPSGTSAPPVVVGRVVEFGQPLPNSRPPASASASQNLPTLDPGTALPLETPPTSQSSTPTVTVPPLPPQPNDRTQARIERDRPSAVEQIPTQVVSAGDGLLLPIGTKLMLRYPGTAPLELKPGLPQQEVLLLQTEIRDRNGNVLAPVDTPVLGRFETDRSGSRFVAQAIALSGRNITLAAESAPLSGRLQVSEDKVVKNSAIGALAGALVGGLSGGDVLGGAAAGAAVTYLTAPKPATLQPGQLIQVQVTEDLR